jgi:SAM-dependent methyltransferase
MRSDRDAVIQKFLVEFAAPDGTDVLEIGCGDGRVAAGLAGWAASYVGLDADPAALAEAETRVPDATFVEGRGEALDFADESFDVVLFTLCLHRMDAEAALDEARRVLRPGGRVVVLEPVPFSEVGRARAVLRDDEADHARAQQAIAEGPLPVVRRELFRTTLEFDDPGEFLDFLFEDYVDPDGFDDLDTFDGGAPAWGAGFPEEPGRCTGAGSDGEDDEDDWDASERDPDLEHLVLSELGPKGGDVPLTLFDDLLVVLLARVD